VARKACGRSTSGSRLPVHPIRFPVATSVIVRCDAVRYALPTDGFATGDVLAARHQIAVNALSAIDRRLIRCLPRVTAPPQAGFRRQTAGNVHLRSKLTVRSENAGACRVSVGERLVERLFFFFFACGSSGSEPPGPPSGPVSGQAATERRRPLPLRTTVSTRSAGSVSRIRPLRQTAFPAAPPAATVEPPLRTTAQRNQPVRPSGPRSLAAVEAHPITPDD